MEDTWGIKAKPLDNLDLLDILTPRPACPLYPLARPWRAFGGLWRKFIEGLALSSSKGRKGYID
jgi:hypothetical protein